LRYNLENGEIMSEYNMRKNNQRLDT